MFKKHALTSGPLLGRKFFPRPSLDLRRPVVLLGWDRDETRSVAFQLAQFLGLVALDCDHVIRYATGRTVAELVAEQGEAAYRRQERRVIESALTSPRRCVLSVGDGALIDSEVRSFVVEKAHLAALTRSLAECFEHLKAHPATPDRWHPLFSGPLTHESQLRYFFKARHTAFDAAAETVDMHGTTPQAAARELAARWTSRSRLAS